MTETYRDRIDAISLSDADKASLLARLDASLDAYEAPPAYAAERVGAPHADLSVAPAAKKGRKRLTSAGIMTIVAASLLGSTAYAVTQGIISVPEAVSHVFSAGPAPIEIANRIGRPIGASDTSNGVTLSADAVMGDRDNLAVVYSIVREDGQPFNWPASVSADCDVATASKTADDFDSPTCPMWQSDGDDGPQWDSDSTPDGIERSSYFFDADPADPAIQYVSMWHFSGLKEPLAGTTYRFAPKNLVSTAWKDGGADNDEIMLAEGSWDLSFEIGYEDLGRDIDVSGTVVDNELGEPANLTSVSLSPLAIDYSFEIAGKDAFDRAESDSVNQSDDYLTREERDAMPHGFLLEDGESFVSSPHTDVSLRLNDGTNLGIVFSGLVASYDKERDVTVFSANAFLPRIVDLDTVEKVVINGAQIALR